MESQAKILFKEKLWEICIAKKYVYLWNTFPPVAIVPNMNSLSFTIQKL